MHRISNGLSAAALSSLIFLAAAAPAAAADPVVAIAQGIPGTKVDICIDGVEVKSAMRYGRRHIRSLDAGDRTITVFRRDARACQGERLLKRTISLVEDDDLTLVLSRKSPRLVVFDNGVGKHSSYKVVRHGADLGSFVVSSGYEGINTPSPSSAPVFVKGDEWSSGTGDGSFSLSLTRPRIGDEPFLRRTFLLGLGYRHEFIVVGTTTGNARLVTIIRPATPL